MTPDGITRTSQHSFGLHRILVASSAIVGISPGICGGMVDTNKISKRKRKMATARRKNEGVAKKFRADQKRQKLQSPHCRRREQSMRGAAM
jgi:hypothetical protein